LLTYITKRKKRKHRVDKAIQKSSVILLNMGVSLHFE